MEALIDKVAAAGEQLELATVAASPSLPSDLELSLGLQQLEVIATDWFTDPLGVLAGFGTLRFCECGLGQLVPPCGATLGARVTSVLPETSPA